MNNTLKTNEQGDINMTDTYPEPPKTYGIIWKQRLNPVELKILLEEWEGFFEVKE